MKKKASIAVDIGGTVEDTWDSKRDWFKLRGYDIGVWPKGRKEVVEALYGNDSLYEKMVKIVYGDEDILNHQLVIGALESLKILSSDFRIVFLSSRPEEKREITAGWMKKMGLWELVDEVVLLGNDNKKMEWCIKSGINIFIDDDKRHLELENKSINIYRIFFCQNPGELTGLSENVCTANDWAEVAKIIKGLKFP